MAFRLNAGQPIVEDNGTMEAPFREYMVVLANNLPIVSTGTPEGVISAPQFSLYIDSAGITGTIEYRKMLTDIGGDITQGWVLV